MKYDKGGGRISSPSHSASGPAFGYLFQLERVLYWLAVSKKSNTIVGIETEDDVTVKTEEEIIWEQDKCSIAPNGYPLSDKSVNLWKTLSIWINAIKENKVEIDNVRFYLVTNKKRSYGLAQKLGASTKGEEDIKEYIKEIRIIGEEIKDHINDLKRKGSNPTKKLEYYVNTVIECDDVLLHGLIRNTIYLDATTTNSIDKQIISALHIPSDLPHDEIIQQLIGWIVSKIKALWEANKPAWIMRDELDKRLWKIKYSLETRVFKETALRDLIPISDEDRRAHLSRRFVTQLMLLNLDEADDIIVQAIADYLHCYSERNRYAQEGCVTEDEFIEFDLNLVERWKKIFNRYTTRVRNGRWNSEEEIGVQIFCETTDHKEKLAGQQTMGYYLTSGTYHMLSDGIRIGWHPRYKILLENNKV